MNIAEKQNNKMLLEALKNIIDCHENAFCDDDNETIPGWFIHAEQVIREVEASQ
ncbi:MAG: hypothetical protein ACUZ8H_10360 [Candidatus Anammoxibacter sp.]